MWFCIVCYRFFFLFFNITAVLLHEQKNIFFSSYACISCYLQHSSPSELRDFRLHCTCSCSIKHHTKMLCGSAMVVMYNEMIMMTMMLLRYSIVVTNNNCFRIILNSLYFSSLTKKNRLRAKCIKKKEFSTTTTTATAKTQNQIEPLHFIVYIRLTMCVSVHGFTHHLFFKDWSLVYPRHYSINSLYLPPVPVYVQYIVFFSYSRLFFVLLDFDC